MKPIFDMGDMKIVDLKPKRWWMRPICRFLGHKIDYRLYVVGNGGEVAHLCRRCGWVYPLGDKDAKTP